MGIMIWTNPPPVRQAYLEAVEAPSPKTRHRWSHPAVYLAGCATGWTVLDGKTDWAWRAFRRYYTIFCARGEQGEDLKALCMEARDGRPASLQAKERQRRAHAKWMPQIRDGLPTENKPQCRGIARRAHESIHDEGDPTGQYSGEATQRPERSSHGHAYLSQLHELFAEEH